MIHDPKFTAYTIEQLTHARGETVKQMLINCGLSDRVISNMKAGSKPSYDKIITIAEYLGVDINDLIYERKDELKDNTETPALSAEEWELLKIYRKLSNKGRDNILSNAHFVAHREGQTRTAPVSFAHKK